MLLFLVVAPAAFFRDMHIPAFVQIVALGFVVLVFVAACFSVS